MSLFSVIIPTYNRANNLGRCLASLVAQSYKNFEVIVCDDGSTDNTKEVVESYRSQLDIVYSQGEHWGGPAVPRNRGIALARTKWICFLDSDDWWYPNKLEECAKYLNSADVIYHDLDVYDNSSGRLFRRMHSRQLTDDPFTDLMLNNNALPNSSVVVRKGILEQVGGMTEDKKLVSTEDFDCWLKIARVTKRFLYIPRTLGVYALGSNISRSVLHVDSLEELWRQHVGNLHTAQEKKFVTKTLKYNQARVYHLNKQYGHALVLYCQAGFMIPAGRLLKYFRTKIFGTK